MSESDMQSVQAALSQAGSLAAAAGLVVLLLWETVHPFIEFSRTPSYSRMRHGARNLLFGVLNAAMVVIVFVGLWLAAASGAEQHRVGLLHVMQDSLALPLWVHALGAILLQDAWMYAWHRLNHAIPLLWRFHRVHHSDTHMDVTTATRFHAGEILFASVLRIPLILLLGLYFWEILLYEVLMFAVVQLHHANVVLPSRLDRALRLLIVTPSLHKVHHSCWRPETDSNFGAFLSIWDRLGRSYRLRKDLSTLQFGLDEGEAGEQQSLSGMLRAPFGRKASGSSHR